jgi:hypothetical protein
LAVSKILGIAPRINIHHSDPAMDTSIITVRQEEQDFQPWYVMFKKFRGRGGGNCPHLIVAAKKRKAIKNTKHNVQGKNCTIRFVGGRRFITRGFSLFAECRGP